LDISQDFLAATQITSTENLNVWAQAGERVPLILVIVDGGGNNEKKKMDLVV
jgi:hypothetical protein